MFWSYRDTGRIAGLALLVSWLVPAGLLAAYNEPLRPLFHYTPQSGWIGDPNGLVYRNGEYHLSYQWNPDDPFWVGHKMHWGHAISTNLVNWQEVSPALYPDASGAMWSGSSVVDWNNTAGFGPQAIVSLYTLAGNPFRQCLAFSQNGRIWTKYSGNPVLGNQGGDNRDPQVIWYAPQSKWVMSLWLRDNEFAFYDSPNLKNWTYLSNFVFPNVIEVPSLFQMPVDGNSGNTRWIFYAGAGAYYVGTFNGSSFTAQGGPYNLNEGNSYTAAQTFSDIPAADGRRILISQGVTDYPEMPWDNHMNFPVELTLRSSAGPLLLFANPVSEIQTLRVNTNTWPAQALAPGANPMGGARGEAFEMEAAFTPGSCTHVGFILRGTLVLYDNQAKQIVCNGLRRWLDPINGQVKFRFLVDRGILEIFGNDGRLYMPMQVVPKTGMLPVGMFAGGSGASLVSLRKHDLKAFWQ